MDFSNQVASPSLSRDIMVLDGCFRSQLSRVRYPRGPDTRQNQLQFNITSPEIVKKVHLDFLYAGANVIRTNSFWASELYMTDFLQSSLDNSVELIQNSVKIARYARDIYIEERGGDRGEFKIAGSCGSATNTGAFSLNNLDRNKLKYFHLLRAQTLLTAGVDMLAFESIETSIEAYAILDLLRELPEAKAWITFRCDGDYLKDNYPVVLAARSCHYMLTKQIIAMGVNCITPSASQKFVETCRQFCSSEIVLPFVVCPKKPHDLELFQNWLPLDKSNQFSVRYFGGCCNVSQLVNNDVRYFGGCCNVLPEDISTIRVELNKLNQLGQF